MAVKRFRARRPAKVHAIDHAAFKQGLHLFCDGACEPNPGPGGWGVAVYRDAFEIDHSHGGEGATTNNRMELTSLLNALQMATALGQPCTIWCDSQYAVKGATEWMKGWKAKGWQRAGSNADPKNRILLNADLWQAIDAAKAAAPLAAIRWCKGHAGIAGNERADELSTMGMLSINDQPTDYLTEDYRRIMAG